MSHCIDLSSESAKKYLTEGNCSVTSISLSGGESFGVACAFYYKDKPGIISRYAFIGTLGVNNFVAERNVENAKRIVSTFLRKNGFGYELEGREFKNLRLLGLDW